MASRCNVLIFFTIFSLLASTGAEAALVSAKQREFVARMLPQIEEVKEASGSEEIRKIPNRLIIAQAAYESAWGTSKAAKNKKNLFGRKKGGELKRFESHPQSIQEHLSLLAESQLYEEFQKKLREGANPEELADSLRGYARKPKYGNELKKMLRSPALSDT